jgi:hypothetical protein
VTGERSKLRFKIGGMAGELASVPAADVEKLLAVAGDRDRAAVLLAAEAGPVSPGPSRTLADCRGHRL